MGLQVNQSLFLFSAITCAQSKWRNTVRACDRPVTEWGTAASLCLRDTRHGLREKGDV